MLSDGQQILPLIFQILPELFVCVLHAEDTGSTNSIFLWGSWKRGGTEINLNNRQADIIMQRQESQLFVRKQFALQWGDPPSLQSLA